MATDRNQLLSDQARERLLAKRETALFTEQLSDCLTLDDALEDLGMHGDNRLTCHHCQAWTDNGHSHDVYGWRR